jgi:nucleoside-diphosphate-sugar epimerase
MVIGSGLLGKAFDAFREKEDILIFCSGVSNSTCQSETEFARESDLLSRSLLDYNNCRFVYFSTCSVYDPTLEHQAYVKHKLLMESKIRNHHNDYLIFRLSNLVGRTDNPHTIINFFYKAIDTGIPFTLWQNAERNLIDVNDVLRVCQHILSQPKFTHRTINIANPTSYPVTEIVNAIEKHLGKTGNYTLQQKGAAFQIPLDDCLPIYDSLQLSFEKGYLTRLLQTYFPL